VPSYPNREWLISVSYIETAITVIIVVVILLAIFFAFLIYKIIQTRKKKVAIGLFKGETAKTVDRVTPEKPGFVRFKGELWHAKSDTVIEPNTKVIVISREEETLKVIPKED
jgi:membrane-bound serine protease (ClpP class)